MSTTSSRTGPQGLITPEAIEACQRRIGILVRSRVRPHNETATEDAIRHFAHGIGDDNPLFCDPGHAAQTPWSGVIAPPMFAMSMGIPKVVEWTEAERDAMSGGDPLAGVGQYLCGERWQFFQPIRSGTKLYKSTALRSADLKKSEFGGGRGALLSHRHVFRDESGAPFVVNDRDFYHAERDRAAKQGKYRAIERTVYTEEDIARIDVAYANEEVRGGQARWFQDVSVGDRLPVVVKGPMTVTDVISYHIGWGWGMFGVNALKLGYRNRQRIPAFYSENSFGVPDAAQRCHWEDSWAQTLGQPAAYDYASMRMNWFAHAITNWMGDSAWLWRFSGVTTRFNYIGDTHWLSGSITDKRETATTAEVDLELTGINQHDDQTCSATATVLLPTRNRPTVQIPPPSPADVNFAPIL